eukprot:m.24874 g.24874  ORF g.24874 m.24874 type:complete len:221 (+) comp13477_c0_seq1:137-799(+)
MGKKPAGIKNVDEASGIILKYLNEQNRPYNAGDIHSNLHNTIGKTAVTKALAALAADGKIIEKINGKAKIYYPDQSQFEKMDPAQLAEIDQEIQGLKDEISQLTRDCSALSSELGGLTSSLTTADAQKELQELEEETANYDARLEPLRNSSEQVSEADRKQVEAALEKNIKFWRKRKRMGNDILGAILENYPKPKKKLYDDIGIETDEAVGVDMNAVVST